MERNSNEPAALQRAALGMLALLAIRAPSTALAVVRAPDEKVEKFEKVDPYTRAQRKELDRAGYISLGPFPIADGIKTGDVEEAFGSIPVLWVETAHFKLGSTLVSYPVAGDERERRALHDELERLSKKIPRARGEPVKLDPWLRLHLYAQRLEELYADFESRFGISDEDFSAKANPDPTRPDYMGPGPYLGEPMKFTVLLTEKNSQIARFAKRWLMADEASFYRGSLSGGSMFFGTSMESSKSCMGSSLDLSLHVLVTQELARTLCFAFRGARVPPPLWFAHGLALWYGRRVDERWCTYVQHTKTDEEDPTSRWEPRVAGLVANDFVPKWDEMLAWSTSTKLEAQHHLTAWSRVSWMMGQDKAKLRSFLLSMTQAPVGNEGAAAPFGLSLDQQKAALSAAFGKSPVDLHRAWGKWVARTYPRK
jgi:hypothetical protein